MGYEAYRRTIALRSGEAFEFRPELTRLSETAPLPSPVQGTGPVEPSTPRGDSARPVVSCAASYAEKQWSVAFDACTRAANAGEAQGQYLLGILYDKGRGAKRNKREARLWYEQAARQGHADAAKRIDELDRESAMSRRPF
jgi:hypothetical protein